MTTGAKDLVTELPEDLENDLKETVKSKYGEAARTAASGGVASCGGGSEAGGTSCCGSAGSDPITSDLYESVDTDGLPEGAVLASLGCGNPTALAELHEGETVLDLGSGGGIDVLLSARRVGPNGRAYGLDMTADMLALARRNQAEAGVENAEFLEGEIEAIPLPDDSVDVVISNCVINLSVDKPRALAEAYRVLKPGGRFAVSDIVVRGEVDERIRRDVELWIGCVAGALEEGEYAALLAEAGFEAIDIEPTRVYGADDTAALLGDSDGAGDAGEAGDADAERREIARKAAGRFMSAFVRAVKPVVKPG